MKVKVIVFTLAVFFISGIVASADSPHMGTWKLNEAKSKFAAGATKNNTVVYEAAGSDIKVTVDGMDGSGAAVHSACDGRLGWRAQPPAAVRRLQPREGRRPVSRGS